MLPGNRDGGLIQSSEDAGIGPPQKTKMPSEKARVQEGWRSSSRGSKTNSNFQLVNKPSWIGPHVVLQSSLIHTVFYLLVKNNKRRGCGVGVKREEGLLLKLSSSEKEGLCKRGGLYRGFKILLLLFFFLPLRCQKMHYPCFNG